MHPNYFLKSKRSSVSKELAKFKHTLQNFEAWRPKEDVDFILLCGANREHNIPSSRRQSLLEFATKHLPNSRFFLAELIFETFLKEGHKGNILDIESDLSQFADHIIIVLESESAFCELGAFANSSKLRNKIIVINDTRHKNTGSFINQGPVKAIEEISGHKNLLYYKMEEDGRYIGDGIGDIYSDLYELLKKEPKPKRNRVREFNPNKFFSKDSLRFIHDLVYLSGPLYFSELHEILIILFEKCTKRNLQKHIALLCAICEIERSDKGLYKSSQKSPYFEYDHFDINSMIASFKNMHYRYDNSRLS